MPETDEKVLRCGHAVSFSPTYSIARVCPGFLSWASIASLRLAGLIHDLNDIFFFPLQHL